MKKFRVALNGLLLGLKDKAILTQYIIALIVIIISLYLELDYISLIIVIMLCFLVITFEYINTSIERICDLISKEYNDKIKYIKDLAAGFVLLQAILSVIVAIILFINMKGI